MGIMESLRTYGERHVDAAPDDWRVAQGNGWRTDTETSADGNVEMEYRVPTNTQAAARVGNIVPDRFIERRPKADRLVYVLLRELEQLNPDAAAKGRAWYDAKRETLTVDEGSNWITRIRAKIAEGPVPAPTPAPVAEVPKANHWARWRELAAELVAVGGQHGARFAVDTEDGATNTVAFWWIVPGKGEYKGRYFLRQIIGGQGAVRVRLSVEAMIAIADKINAAGPYEAMLRFGRELGRCGHCGTELTNDESRALGIGPVCRRKHG